MTHEADQSVFARMTPEELKAAIRREYTELIRRRVNNVDTLIEARCREAARHNGVPENWRYYLPHGEAS